MCQVRVAFAPAILAVGLVYSCGASALAASSSPEASVERIFELTIVGGKVPSDKRIVRVKQNEIVRLRWSADAPAVLHLHGYNIERRVTPGEIAEMRFQAHATGRYPVHIHPPDLPAGGQHHQLPLAHIEVYPP